MLKTIAGLFVFYSVVLPIKAMEIDQFAAIYNKQCATCHGNKGNGKGRVGASFIPAPTNFMSDKSKARLTSAKIIAAIRDGIPGTAMSAYGRRFDENTLSGLAEYIQQTFMGKKTLAEEPEPEDEGRAIYVEHCSACHGDNGNTAVWARNALNPAPRNFTSAQAKAELSRERMRMSVTYGRPGTAMMSFQKRLSQAQIDAVVAFIRRTFMKVSDDVMPVNAVDMSLPFSNGLVGDIAAGEHFFNHNCYVCHGKKGNGKGPRAYFNQPRPRDFTSSESRRILNRPRLFRSISHGKARTVMPAWSKVLTEQQIADVAEYVFQAFVLQTRQKKKR